MAGKTSFVFLKDWYDALMDDEHLDMSEQEFAYILYAAMLYAFDGTKINFGEVFGKEFKGLQYAMPELYGQMDRIKTANAGRTNRKYDNDKVRELAEMGMTQKDICKELGIPEDRSRSLSSNPGYIEGRKIWKERKGS